MRIFATATAVAITLLSSSGVVSGIADAPRWAYPTFQRGFRPDPDDGQPKRLAGSARAYTYSQIEDAFNPADWYPREHPQMPAVPVAHGRKPNVQACSWCHLPNGLGHPQSAGIAGLPAAYIEEQLFNFKLGLRLSSFGNSIMGTIARGLTANEAHAAAMYFASLKPTPWIKVVETANVPKARTVEGLLRIPLEPRQTEPLGQRIVELPQYPARTRMYDSHAGFIAYVPMGSVKRGENLVTTGGAQVIAGKTVPGKIVSCSMCHGAALRGMPSAPGRDIPVPALAGRSAIYIVRQLYDFQSGVRIDASAALMKAVAAPLSHQDMIDIAAYIASREP